MGGRGDQQRRDQSLRRQKADFLGNSAGAPPWGRIQFADIAHGKPVPEEAIRNVDLWTS